LERMGGGDGEEERRRRVLGDHGVPDIASGGEAGLPFGHPGSPEALPPEAMQVPRLPGERGAEGGGTRPGGAKRRGRGEG